MKKLFTLFLLAFLPLLASSDPVEIDGLYYNLNSSDGINTAEVTSSRYWGSYSGDIVIPESVTYEDVTYNVTSIGYDAFRGCSGLTSITIPNSVTSIGSSAFWGCRGLTSITIPNSVTSIGSYAFQYCSALTSVTIGISVTSIGSGAFEDCSGLTSITIPNSVTLIEQWAFLDCSGLTSITIPNSVTSIGDRAFVGCSGLTSIEVEDGNTKYDSRDNCNAIIETVTNTLIVGCKNSIIPNSVTSIGIDAFAGCTGLTSIIIPNSVTSIDDSAFFGCSNLTSINIPNSVNSIYTGAFQGCSGLTSIEVENGNTKYDSRDNCNAIIETESNTLVYGCKNTTIPNSVTSIGSMAFYECSGLTSISIPGSVTSIGEHAFSRCENLTSATILDGVTSIGGWAFYQCYKLSSIVIPNSVTSIEPRAFFDCHANTLSIGSGVKSIGYCAFGCFGQLTDVFCYAKDVPYADKAFDEDEEISKNYTQYLVLHVPAGSVEAYKATEPWNEFKEIVAIEDEEETAEDVIKITSAMQTTWCSAYDLDFSNVEGLKAYTATGYHRTKGTIWLTRVKEVPAGEGILLIGDEGEYRVPHKSTTAYYANLMVGTVKAITINETDGEYTNYYLSNGASGVGFYKVNGSVEIKANRAYLPLLKNTVSGTRGFIGMDFDDDEDGTTGISEVQQRVGEPDVYYNLQGQRVDNPSKGLFIRNGKKVIIK